MDQTEIKHKAAQLSNHKSSWPAYLANASPIFPLKIAVSLAKSILHACESIHKAERPTPSQTTHHSTSTPVQVTPSKCTGHKIILDEVTTVIRWSSSRSTKFKRMAINQLWPQSFCMSHIWLPFPHQCAIPQEFYKDESNASFQSL